MQRHDVSVSESNPFSSNRDLIAANKFTIDIGSNSYSNLTAEGLSGQGDPKNFSMVYWRWTSPKNNKFFSWKGFIRDGSGRTKEFFTEAYEWHKPHTKSFKKDFNTYTFDLPPRNWLPCHLFICKEVLPNGNILKYEYSPWRGSKLCPTPFNLQQITAYDSKEEKILARIDFDYQKYSWTHHLDIGGTHQKYEIKVEENRGFGIHGSDGRKAYCQHNKRHNLSRPIVLENVNTPTHDIHYNYNIKNWRLIELDCGLKRKFRTEYNSDNKVSAQFAPLGPNGEMLPLARYDYRPSHTNVFNAEGHLTIYHFNSDKKITTVEKQMDHRPYCFERSTWDKGRLQYRCLFDGNERLLQKTEFVYDSNGNVIQEIQEGIECPLYTIYRTYSNDGYNLKLSESDNTGKITRFSYEPQSNRLSKELVYSHDQIVKRSFFTYDSAAICLKAIVDDGQTEDPNNLEGITYRLITYITPKYSLPCYGLPETVEEKILNEAHEEVLLKRDHYTYHPSGKVLLTQEKMLKVISATPSNMSMITKRDSSKKKTLKETGHFTPTMNATIF